MGELPTANLDLSTFFPSSILGEYTFVINNSGDLAPDPPVPGDLSAMDEEKLTDIFLYLEYGIE